MGAIRFAILAVLTALCCVACAAATTDRDPTPEAVTAASEWLETVGVMRRDWTLDVRTDAPVSEAQGEAICDESPARLVLVQGSFRAAEFEANVRHVMLHELVHLHLGCHATDHSKDPANLMYPELTDENIDASPDVKTIAFIREAWLR